MHTDCWRGSFGKQQAGPGFSSGLFEEISTGRGDSGGHRSSFQSKFKSSYDGFNNMHAEIEGLKEEIIDYDLSTKAMAHAIRWA